MRGGARNTKSEAQRKLEGSRKRPWHRPQPRLAAGAPVAPAGLTATEREYWDYYVAQLLAMKVLTAADQGVLVNYCRALAQLDDIAAQQAAPEYRRVMVSIIIDGAGNEKVRAESNPLDGQLRQWTQLARLCAADLGLSPSARARVSPVEGESHETQDPLERLLRRVK